MTVLPDSCILTPPPPKEALAQAERLCAARAVRLTRIRRALLELLLCNRRAMKAYEFVAKIETVLGRTLMPTTVYRALNFLVEQGLISRIESRNAYVALADPTTRQASIFFVCDSCEISWQTDSPDLERVILRDAAAIGFLFGKHAVEIRGTCVQCRACETRHGGFSDGA